VIFGHTGVFTRSATSSYGLLIYLYLFICLSIDLFQRELDEVRTSWNNHKIRQSKNDRLPVGRPVIMYRCPQVCGCEDYLCNVTQNKVNICLQQCTPKSDHTCEKTIFELCCFLMTDHQLKYPQTADEGIHLYTFLREKINEGLAEYR